MYCDKCNKNSVFICGECTACNGHVIKSINDLMLVLGVDLGEVLKPLTKAPQSITDIPDEKQIARQRSKDNLKAKRRSSRRGGSEYRRR